MPLRPMIPVSRRADRPRRSFVLGLIAIWAMILAGPTHLWLAHGHAGHDAAGTEVAAVVGGGCHGHHCGGHGHGPLETDSEKPAEQPCDDASGDCDICVVIAGSTPLATTAPIPLAALEPIDVIVLVDQDVAGFLDRRSFRPRGPPRSA